LGWSQRTNDPTEVDVAVHPPDSAEQLAQNNPLSQALHTTSLATDTEHRPLHDGRPMITLAEAALMTGKERSWLSREMTTGHLRAMKIGRTWWTYTDWVQDYLNGRHRKRKDKAAAR
jgi:hypothetical protein